MHAHCTAKPIKCVECILVLNTPPHAYWVATLNTGRKDRRYSLLYAYDSVLSIMTAEKKRELIHVREWGVLVERTIDTETSLISFGARDSQSVVLKLIKEPGDEWRSGEVLKH